MKKPRNKGRQSLGRGYFTVIRPNHPFADNKGRVLEHRFVMEQKLGRILDPDTEWVHHKNGLKGDNNPENLEVMSPRDHLRLHAGWRQLNGMWYRTCGGCNRELGVCEANFYRHKNGGHNEFYSRCIECLRVECKERAKRNRRKLWNRATN